jgi:ABC-2 type transport system permease protein
MFVQVIFGHIRAIAGWSRLEIMLLSVTQMLTWSVMNYSLVPGLSSLIEKIKQGSLDMVLVKPVSSRLLMAITNQNIDGLFPIVVLFITALAIAKNTTGELAYVTIGAYAILILLGTFILSNIFWVIHSSAFWLTNLFNIGHLNNTIASSAQFPPAIYNPKVRLVISYLIPTVFTAPIPARVLLGDPALPSIILAIIVAALTFVISQFFWDFALKHYSSASS